MNTQKQAYEVTFREQWTNRISSKVLNLTSKREKELSRNMSEGIPIRVYSKVLSKLTGGNETFWVMYVQNIKKV